MERIKLQRTGKRPLAFRGEILFEGSTSPDRGRWHLIQVYRTVRGQYVVYIIRYTNWEGERDIYEAEVLSTPEAAVSWVEKNNPYWAGEVAEALGVAEEI